MLKKSLQLRRELTAKAAGLEFVSASELRKEYNRDSAEEETKEEDGHDTERDDNLEEKGVVVYKKVELVQIQFSFVNCFPYNPEF